ncbi:MAG: peptide deformylase [Actinomycetota bacterium]|nr:peptide deformylase [Actinomycetota bacterium]
MAILPIRTFGDPVLRERAAEVGPITEVHRRLVLDMLETMRAAPGVGLAGPQVGVMERVFVYEVDARAGAIFDPVIVARSDELNEWEEGCLSIPGLYYPVIRPAEVRVEGRDETGAAVRLEADGLLARVVQHETDHLDGILFIDRLSDEARADAMRVLRDQALGLPGAPPVRSGSGDHP